MNEATPATEPASPAVETIRASALVETPPEPSAHVAANAEAATPPAAAPRPAPKLDRRGTSFDPSKHIDRIHPISGNWMPKKPKRPDVVSTLGHGRKRSTVAPDEGASTVATDTAGEDDGDSPASAVEIARMVTAQTLIGIIQTALILVGKEEGILDETEKLMISGPLERCLKKYSVGEMPEELELCAALAAVIITRLKKPKTAAAWERFKAWFVNWRLRARGRVTAANITKATQ